MKVALNEKIAQLDTAQSAPITFFRSPQYESSITPLRAAPKNRILALFSSAYEAIKRKVVAFFIWVRSWFAKPPKEKQVDYYKVQGPDGNEMKYRLIVDGEGTDTEIRLGQKYAFLQHITPDVKDISKFSAMIDQMMTKEKIDCIQTNNLSQAHLLWKAGLKTKSLVNFNFAPDLLNTYIIEVVQRAMDNKGTLSAAGQQALLRLEGQIVRCVVYEQYAIEDIFSPDLCRGMLNDVEALFNYSFDLQALIQKAEREKEVEYAKTLNSILSRNSNNRGPVVDCQFEIFLCDLFILMEATKTPMNRAIIQTLPNLTFTKRN